MTPMLEESAILPSLDTWHLGQAAWQGEGGTLTARAAPHGAMLTSQPFVLAGGCIHEIRLTLTIRTGGATFGVQDANGCQWLQVGHHTTRGRRQCRLTLRLQEPGRFRLLLANCNTDKSAPTCLTNMQLDMDSRPIQTPMPAERWKQEIRSQWDTDPCGDDRGAGHDRGTLEYFQAVEQDRYEQYAPWMKAAIGFKNYAGKDLLEIGGGLGTDLAQFAYTGAHVTNLDMSQTHLNLARRNFAVRGLPGQFVLGDAEILPFPNARFDVVYAFGVIHHTPGTEQAIQQIHRVLKPGGEAIVMVYAKHSWNYWHTDVYRLWWQQGLRKTMSMADILSANTEHSPSGARPLVKVYTARQARNLFANFRNVRIRKFQLTPGELPAWMRRLAPMRFWEKHLGWNLLINAVK